MPIDLYELLKRIILFSECQLVHVSGMLCTDHVICKHCPSPHTNYLVSKWGSKDFLDPPLDPQCYEEWVQNIPGLLARL